MTNAPDATKPQPKPSRREKRWAKAVPFEQLPAARQVALRLVDAFEDAILLLHLAVFGFVAFVHLVWPTRGFFLFVVGYETFVRDYWFIERMEHGEYGMWPGILAALGLDALFMALLVLPLVLPFVIARHFIVRDEQRLKDVLVEYVILSVFLLLLTYVVGSVAGTFVVLIVGGLAGVFADVSGLLAPVGSAILITDLLFATAMWWIDRAAAPRGMSRWWRIGLGAAGAVALIAGAQVFLSVQAHVEGEEVDGLVLFIGGERIEHQSEGTGALRKATKVTRKLDFDEGEMVAPRSQRLYSFAPGAPFFMDREPFYHSPPHEIWLDGRQLRLSYALHPWTGKPKRSATKVTLRPDEGKGFYDQYQHVIEDKSGWGFSVEVKPVDVTAGVSYGLVSQHPDAETLYLMVDGRQVRLYEVAKSLTELVQHQAKQKISRVGLFNVHGGGTVLTIDGRPVWVLDYHVPAKVGPAMLRRPRLKSDDTAVLEVITYAAPPLGRDKIRRSSRIITPPV